MPVKPYTWVGKDGRTYTTEDPTVLARRVRYGFMTLKEYKEATKDE